MNDNLFTPHVPGFPGLRAHMTLSDADKAKIQRGKRWTATVFDHSSNRRYKVRGAGCGSPHCFCAAVIVEQLP